MKKYLDYFQLIKEHYSVKPFKIMFNAGLNIIVGENGSGKSTMLHIMTNLSRYNEIAKVKFVSKTPPSFKFLDTEKMNPRKTDVNSQPNLIKFLVSSHFTSHGESILPLIKSCLEFKNEVIFIDEPEAGISLSNQLKILEIFKKSEKQGCQLIVTTHSYPIIKNANTVFSLDCKKWIASSTFLKEF